MSRAEPAVLTLTGPWQINVTARDAAGEPVTARLDVTPPPLLSVRGEKLAIVPIFNPRAGGWVKGVALAAVRAQECTTPYLLEPESLEVRSGPEPDAPLLIRGTDYEADLAWATIGRLTTGSLKENQPVFASYRHGLLRIDSVVLTREGRIVLRAGEAKPAAPLPPQLDEGERRLANLWLPGRITKLEPEHLFPVLETAFPEPQPQSPSPADRFAPRTLAKLRSGRPLRILAWGDSVTVGTFLPDWAHQRWQEQFITRLRTAFPKAQIELVTEAWGGRNTGSYLAEPPGAEHNYAEKVLAAKADLIVSEFVNDAGLNEEQVERQYGKLLADFKAAGAEWIILSPHYVRPDWMGLTKEREIDDDPRPYVKGLRQFTSKHQLALADAAARYGRLWRQGLPYSTLMLNSINHPDARGMRLFADSLMALFAEQPIDARSLVSEGDTARLQAALAKARRGEVVTVGVIGGSITQGAAASTPENRYGNKVAAWWRQHFPKASIQFVNAGIGATGSSYGALRADRDLLSQRPDLVIAEYSVNDPNDRSAAETLEGLARQVLKRDNHPALVLLFTMNQSGANAQEWHGKVGAHYSLPMISYRDALWPEIQAGRMAWTDISPDAVHPNDRGHGECARFVTRLLDQLLQELPPDDRLPAVKPLPPPLLTDSYEWVGLYEAEALKPVINQGWAYDSKSRCWRSEQPGSIIEFDVQGRILSTMHYVVRGPMGRVKVSVDGRVARELDGWFDQTWGGYRQTNEIIRDLVPGEHRVRFELLPTKNPQSPGTEFRILGLGTAGTK